VNSIFVGNLSFSVREQDLRQAFERFGRVASVRIMTDPSTSQCRGFAFVSMPSLDDADEAIRHMSGASLGGRQLTVNASQNDNRGPRQGGAAGGSSKERAKALDLFERIRGE
jgi:RNA recognition motif-containing protein